MATNPTIKIQVDSSQATNSIGAINDVIKNLGASFEKLDTQAKFDKLRKQIADTKKEVEALEKANVTSTKEYKKSIDTLNQLEAAYAELSSTNADLGASFEDVYGEVKPLTAQIGELEDRLYQMALAGEQNTEQFKQVQAETAKLKRAIIETDQAVDNLAENKGLAGFSSLIGGIGDSLLSLDFESANKQASALGALSKNISFGQATASLKQLGSTFLNLGKALLTNPLFLLAAVIIGIVAAIVKVLDKIGVLKKITEAIGAVFEWLGNTINDWIIEPLKALTDWLGWTANAAEESAQRQADAAKKAADAQRKYSEERIQQLDNQIRLAELEGKSTTQLEREKVQLLRKTAQEQAKADRLAFDAAVKKGELSKEEIANLKEVARQSRLTYEQSVADVKFFESETKKERENASKEREEKEKEELEKRKQREKEWADARRDALKTIRQIEQEYADSQLGDEEKEIVQLQRKYDELFKLANKYGIDTTKLTEAFLNEQNNIRVKYAQKEIDDENAKQEKLKKAEKEANDKALQDEEDFYEEYRKATQTAQQNEIDDVNDKYFNLIENAKKYGLDITGLQRKQNEETAEINDKYRKEEEEKEKAANEAKLNAIRGTADALVAAVDSAFTGTFDQISESFDALGESLFGEEGLFAKLKEGSISAMEAIAVGVETITGVLNSVFEMQEEKALEASGERFEASNEKYDELLANRLISQEQYDAKVRQLEDKKDEQEKQARLKAFKQSKALAIVNAIMTTAQAVLAAFSSAAAIPIAGVAMGPIMAGVAGALGAAQIAIISSQQFKAARGGIVPGSGPSTIDSVDAKLAPGETVINAQSSSMFPQLLSELNQMGGGVSLAPEPVQNMTSNQTTVFEPQGGPLRAYVVEQDMTDSQRRVRRMENAGTFS